MLAALAGARVVALDTDLAAIDQLWIRASKESRNILPLVVNIARPSPALGWENSESMSFLDRAEQRFDLVMMLAVHSSSTADGPDSAGANCRSRRQA